MAEIPEKVMDRAVRAVCLERNAGDCVLGCTKDSGCLSIRFSEGETEYRLARAALSAAGVGEMVKGAQAFDAYEKAMGRGDDVAAMRHYDEARTNLLSALSSFTGG